MNSGTQAYDSSNKRCPKCDCLRTPNDLAPHGECPRCGIVYVKYDNLVEKESPSYPKLEQTPEKSNRHTFIILGVILVVFCLVPVYFFLVKKPTVNDSQPVSTENTQVAVNDLQPASTKNTQVAVNDLQPVSTDNTQVAVNDSQPVSTKNTQETVNVSQPISTKDTQVTLLSTTWCGYCKLAKNYLDKHNVDYVELDIEKSEEGRRLYNELNGRGIPIILIGETRLNGYNEEKLKQALQKIKLM